MPVPERSSVNECPACGACGANDCTPATCLGEAEFERQRVIEGRASVQEARAYVESLEAEVERLRESRDRWKCGYEAKEAGLAALRDRASAPTPCNACGTSTDSTAACHAHSWHNA